MYGGNDAPHGGRRPRQFNDYGCISQAQEAPPAAERAYAEARGLHVQGSCERRAERINLRSGVVDSAVANRATGRRSTAARDPDARRVDCGDAAPGRSAGAGPLGPRGADPNGANTQALCVAVHDGSHAIVRLLLDAGANVNARRCLPLILAVDAGHLSCV